MTLHADAVRVLTEWRPPSEDQSRLRDRYLTCLAAHPDATARGCLPEHLTASLMVLDSSLERVLLTLHAKSGQWFQLGGHLEPGDATLADGALREGVEESGIDAAYLELDRVPVLLDAHAVPFCGGENTWHLDVMYVAVADPAAQHVISAESLDLAWWPVGELPNPELTPFVARTRRRAGESGLGRGAGGDGSQAMPSVS